METANPNLDNRHDAIATALNAEIDRQARAGANRIDLDALAEAVEEVIASPQASLDGKSPGDLNATNDD